MSLVDLGKRLLHASKIGDVEEVRALMANGAPFTTDWLGTSPLHFAANYGHRGTAEVLLRSGISRDARTKVDRTPLHIASQEGHLGIVELLLMNGADIEAKDMLKMTPLHWAVERGHTNVATVLVHKGADVNCEDKFDRTAIHIAVANDRIDVIGTLQNASHATETMLPGNLDIHTTEVTTEVIETEPIIVGTESLEAEHVYPNVSNFIAPDGTDQSSTSVLATLAALAEATAPLSTAQASTTGSSSDALNWLESHGVTVISSDGTKIVTSGLESGESLTLTEAGKLALNFVKTQAAEKESIVLPGDEVGDEDKRVIAIVSDDDKADTDRLVVSMDADDNSKDDEPASKRLRLVQGEMSSKDKSYDAMGPEELKRHLEAIQKEAKQYKEQLREKEEEAEGYKRKLTELSKKDDS